MVVWGIVLMVLRPIEAIPHQGHFPLNVNAVGQRTRSHCAVTLNLERGAAALSLRVAAVTARASMQDVVTRHYHPLSRGVFNPDCPAHLRTPGERIRKARMDRGLEIKELAELIRVTPDTVIN